jgi:dienelactone hydrolase
MEHRKIGHYFTSLILCVGVCLCAASRSQAADVTLKDGTVIKGSKWLIESSVGGGKTAKIDPDQSPNKCIIMLEDVGAVRVYVPRQQVVTFNKENDLKAGDAFLLKREPGYRGERFEVVGGKISETPFDVYGRRMATFMQTNHKQVDVMQQIIELHPKYIRVTAIKYLWEFGLPTSSLPPEILHALLRRALPKDTADGRFSIVRFCLEGGFFPIAQHELNTIAKDFPDRANDVKDYTQRLKQYLADEAVRILEERRVAGQRQFAYSTAKQFLSLDLPDVSAATIQKLQKEVANDDATLARLEESQQLMGLLQGQLSVEEAAEVAPIRKIIGENINVDTMDRLASFLNLADAENREPADKLALAISGWVLGADEAITSLPQALRIWRARDLVMKYLRSENSPERVAVIEELEKLEGLSHSQIVRILKLLPPTVETVEATPSVPLTVEIPSTDDSTDAVKYELLLPPEYHHGRAYPVIVALHAAGLTPQIELGWWARLAQRYGYVVVAPTFVEANQRHYDYSPGAHHAVLETIRDLKKRFTIDSDRIFLGGHGLGGDATFDISFSHPDLFAGAIPISASFEKFSSVYRDNAKALPLFILAGELDRDLLSKNALEFTKMMEYHHPVVYTVLLGRGFEHFQSEDGRIFDWMSHQSRMPLPTRIEMKSVRTTDNQFWWWTFSNFPPKFGITAWPETVRRAPRPMTLNAIASKAKGDNVLNISCGARRHAIWLFPEVVSFEKMLTIRHAEQQIYHAIPEPNIAASLEDFRLRYDRQRIAWAYLEVGMPARPTVNLRSPAALRAQRISARAK